MLQHVPGSGNEGDVSTIQVPEGIDGSPSGGVAIPANEDTAMASTGSKYGVQLNDANEELPARD